MVKRKTRLKIFLAYALCILMAGVLNTCASYLQQMDMESYGYISDYEAMRFGTGSGLWTILLYGGLGLWLPSAIAKELKKDDEAERAKEAEAKKRQDAAGNKADHETITEAAEPSDAETQTHEQTSDDLEDGKYAFERSEYEFRPQGGPKKREKLISWAWAALAIVPIVFCAIFVLVLLINGGTANEAEGEARQTQEEQIETEEQEPDSNEELEQVPEDASTVSINQELDEVEALEQAIEENRREYELAELAIKIDYEPELAAVTMQQAQTEYERLCARYIEALEQAIEENRETYRLAEFGTRANIRPEVSAYIMQQAQAEYEELSEKYQEALAEYEEIGNDIGYNAEEEVTMPPNAEEPNADAEHGEILVRPAYECVCPFAVKTLSGGNSYYIRLRYIEPEYSAEIRDSRIRSSQGNEDDIAVFCTGGDLEINVPPGKYELWYCTGSTWRGTDTYFGNDTTWYMSEELLEFSEDEEYVYGNTVTLYPVAYGNFDTTEVASYEIPEDF